MCCVALSLHPVISYLYPDTATLCSVELIICLVKQLHMSLQFFFCVQYALHYVVISIYSAKTFKHYDQPPERSFTLPLLCLWCLYSSLK